jgi:gamma-glutamyltranspeptidase / glutathione hydrolase
LTRSNAKSGVVSSPHPAATEAGVGVLKAGGNAIDAAVAAAFTVGVVEAQRTGIAGFCGSIVAYIARLKRVVVIECNSTAPSAAKADMFRTVPSADGRSYTVPDAPHAVGPLSVGVPGLPAGLALFLKRYGTITLSDALKPAIKAAQDGFVVNTDYSTEVARSVRAIRAFPATSKVAMPDGSVPQPGEILRFPELADTLKLMAQRGVEEFYRGALAKTIVAYVRSIGGILSEEDMASYEAVETKPLKVSYRGYEIFTPPLTSGGLTTLQMLKVVEDFPISELGAGSAELYHLLIETGKACWKRRLLRYGDPRYVEIDQEAELRQSTIRELRKEVSAGLKKPSAGELISPEPLGCTSHLCVTDTAGNWVSLTETIGATYGSLVTVPGTGLTLGHGVGRFDPRPGLANSIAPGKKPLNNMSPLIVLKDGSPVASLGAPGGRTILNNMLLFVIGMVDFKQTPAQILKAPRCCIESIEPAQIEWTLDESVFEKLRQRGHQVSKVLRLGGPAHMIAVDSKGKISGATDPRDEGAVGYA